jgi:hypothetical protein
MGVSDFKFFQPARPNMTRAREAFMRRREILNERQQDVEWWEEDDVVEAMTPDDNVIQNNILYTRIQQLEDHNVRLQRENTELFLENRRLTNR